MMRHACGQSTRAVAISRPRRAGGSEIGAHGGEIGHVAGGHALERRLPAEERVGSLDPAIGECRVRIDDLQRLPDAGDIADAPQRVFRHPYRLALLPFEERPLGRRAQDPAGALVLDPPALHDAEEALDGEALLVGRHSLGDGGGYQAHAAVSISCSIWHENCKSATDLKFRILKVPQRYVNHTAVSRRKSPRMGRRATMAREAR